MKSVGCRLFPWLLLLLACACSTAPPPSTANPLAAVVPEADFPALELHHQILFENGDEQQVFEGTMIGAKDAFLVRAFAGPGVDLFTVVRTPTTSTEEAHVPGLSTRVDMAQVGDDIERIYRRGCADSLGLTRACDSKGERLEETLNASGHLVRRVYPDAHGTGLTIAYEQQEQMCGTRLPRRITLTWGEGRRRMVIFTAQCQKRDNLPPELLR